MQGLWLSPVEQNSTASDALQPSLCQEREFQGKVGARLPARLSERKMKGPRSSGELVFAFEPTPRKESCFLSSAVCKHLFLPGCVLGNEIFGCSQQGDQWIALYRWAHSWGHSRTWKWLVFVSQGSRSSCSCGIYSLEATYWPLIWDLNYLVILHVESVSHTFFLWPRTSF